MPDPRVLVESCAGGFVRILLSRPARRNALVPEMVLALTEALGADDGSRPVLLCSADPAAFCAGADLSQSLAEQAATSELLYSCYEQMITRPGPVIAVIEGPAVGGGAQLAAAADIRVGGPAARLRWAGPAGHGLTVGTWIVPELAGQSQGMDIVLSGRWVDAAEALALGLLTHLEPEPARAASLIAGELAARDQATWTRRKLMKSDVLLGRLQSERTANGAAFAALAAGGEPGIREGAGAEWSRASWRQHLPDATDPWQAALALGSQTIPELAAETARRSPGKTAVVIDGHALTHGELDDEAGRTAGWLTGRVAPGDRVLVAGRSSLEFVCAYLGVLRAGAVAVLANPAYTAAELGHLVADSGAALALADAEPAARLAGLVSVVGLGEVRRAARLEAVRAPRPQPDDVALLAYTSGTTGRPKGVPLTHRQLSVSIRAAMAAWRWEPGDVLVHSLPLYHQHGLSGLHTALIAGSAAHISSAFDAAELIGRSTAARASVLFAVPTIYQALLAQQADAIGPVLGGLRLAVCGSAPLSPELAERLPALLGKLPLVRYGTTESGLNISQPYDDSQPETVGVPLPGTLARIWADGAEAAPGRDGEIQVRGPQVFGGYWRDSAATSAAFTADGWFRTGDIGAIDPSSGHMAIRGRSKEVIITGGLNVYPREVELVLEGHPAIAEAVVAGVPDERWGERVTAWVVRNRGTTLNSDALIAHARSLLAPYKCPKQVIEIAEVPRSGMGKVLRQALPPAPPI